MDSAENCRIRVNRKEIRLRKPTSAIFCRLIGRAYSGNWRNKEVDSKADALLLILFFNNGYLNLLTNSTRFSDSSEKSSYAFP